MFALVRRAWPYRALTRERFDAVVRMLADGFATRRGRRSALLHRDEVNGRIRARRGSRSLAITSGGAIPEVADYRVVLDPEDTFIGTLNEDFAIESMPATSFSSATRRGRSCRWAPAWCASRTRRARRRRCRSGWARRPGAATSCPAPSAICAATWSLEPAGASSQPSRRPEGPTRLLTTSVD
jgi:hypothetical protein